MSQVSKLNSENIAEIPLHVPNDVEDNVVQNDSKTPLIEEEEEEKGMDQELEQQEREQEQEVKDETTEVAEVTDLGNLGHLKIEMELGSGHVFQFTLDMAVADKELDSVAAKFCADHAEEIGVDVVNIESGCVEPVMRFLTEQVNTHNAKQLEQTIESNIISVDLDVEGSTVHFEVDAAQPTSAKDQATIFCTQYGAQFGVTEETLPSCINNIQQALERNIAHQKTETEETKITEAEAEAEAEAEKIETEAETEAEVRDVPTEQLTEQQSETKTDTDTETSSKITNPEVFVSSFPLGSKNFEYRYVLGLDATSNAVTFCQTLWSDLEGAFVEAGMTGIDRKTCALIVEEVTMPRIQHFIETREA